MIKLTSDNTKIFKNERNNSDGSTSTYYTYSISNKKQDGTYDYMSKICRFMKGKEPSESCKIKINNAFLSFYISGDTKNDYLMILDYEILEDSGNSVTSDEVVLTDDMLPF